MRHTATLPAGAVMACLLVGALSGCGGGGSAAPPSGGSSLVAVPATDSLRSPDGPISAEALYAMDPSAVARDFNFSPDPLAAQYLSEIEAQAGAAGQGSTPVAARAFKAAASQPATYTYLYCYATGWLQDGTQHLPLNDGSSLYLHVWAKQVQADGSSTYVKVPIVAPPSSLLRVTSRHLVYYTTQYTPSQLDGMCKASLLAEGESLRKQEYPGQSAPLVVRDVVAIGRNNALGDDHPFLPWSGTVGDGHIHTLVSLGDSLSDSDATSNMLFHILPNRSTWFAGRFTNGWVWREYAAADLGVLAYNEAWGGAGTTAQSLLRAFPGANWIARRGVGYYLPSTVQQTGQYAKYVLDVSARNPAETLYTLLIGGNDFISYDESVSSVLNGVRTTLDDLISIDGARNIVVLNLPDVTSAPVFSGSKAGSKARVEADLNAYDDALPALVQQVSAQYPSANVTLFDTRGVFNAILQDPQAYGLVNTTQTCLRDPSSSYSLSEKMRTGCNGYNYLFWDGLHPTTAVHQILGDSFAAFARQHYSF